LWYPRVVCGPHSALGLEDAERELWPPLRDHLRQPGQMMALMRGVLGGDTEIACVATVTPAGVVHPVAILATLAIVDEISLLPAGDVTPFSIRPARIGSDDVEVVVGEDDRPVAVMVNSWIFQHLTLYSRKLWSRR
jgi:hypothetical protein